MAYAKYERAVQDAAGNLVTGVYAEVRRESDNALVALYSGPSGGALANPAGPYADGKVKFYTPGALGGLKVRVYGPGVDVTYRNEPCGTLAYLDTDALAPVVLQGTWTPSLTFNGNAVGMTYARRQASFYLVEDWLSVFVDIQLSSKGSSTGQVFVEGLPYVAGPSANYEGLLIPAYYSNLASITGAIMGTGTINQGKFTIRQGGTATCTPLSDANFTNSSQFQVYAQLRVVV